MPVLITPEDASQFLEDESAAASLCSPLDDAVRLQMEDAKI
jgi:hypothetical protein